MTCQCGHKIGDHKSSRSRGLRVHMGICLIDGCNCREYRPEPYRDRDHFDQLQDARAEHAADTGEPPISHAEALRRFFAP